MRRIIRYRKVASEHAECMARLSRLEDRMGGCNSPEIARYLIKSHWSVLDKLYVSGGRQSPTRCRLCSYEGQESDFKPFESQCMFLGGNLLRHQCPRCDVIFGPSKMLDLDDEMLDMDYRLHYRIFSEGDSTEKIVRAFSLLRPNKDGVYLDYGCGVANPRHLQQIREQGYRVIGYEPSLDCSSEFVFKTMEEMSGIRFNGILSHNVLEHLFQPIATTQQLRELLVDDGLLVHATPCFEYLYEYTRFHVFFFVGKSMDFLAAEAGMKIVDFVRDMESDFMAAILAKADIDVVPDKDNMVVETRVPRP
jgi:SAM-dependent methyltransferase